MIKDAEVTERSYRRVEITSDVPEFKGTDLTNYGPFESGEIQVLPKDNVDILESRDNAVVEEEEVATFLYHKGCGGFFLHDRHQGHLDVDFVCLVFVCSECEENYEVETVPLEEDSDKAEKFSSEIERIKHGRSKPGDMNEPTKKLVEIEKSEERKEKSLGDFDE